MEYFSRREIKRIKKFVEDTRGRADICLINGMHGEDLPEDMTPLILDALETFVRFYENAQEDK